MSSDKKDIINSLHAEIVELRSKVHDYEKEKNYVKGGWYMMTKTSERHIRNLVRKSGSALLLFSLICQEMSIGTNKCTIHNTVAAEAIGVNEKTVRRAAKLLEEANFVRISKHKNVKTYEVNQLLAFAGTAQQRSSVYKDSINIEALENKKEVKLRKCSSITTV